MIISKIIAEKIQDYLEDYIDVFVGNASKIEPSLLIEEELDYLIIGDIVSEIIPSVEIQNWVLKYKDLLKNNNINIKALSGFYIALSDIKNQNFWIDFVKEKISHEMIYPPILHLQLNRADFIKMNRAIDLVKKYSNNFINYLLNI